MSMAIGAENPSLLRLRTLTRMFPALVVPLELRESSEQVTDAVRGARGPIVRMLETLARDFARRRSVVVCARSHHQHGLADSRK